MNKNINVINLAATRQELFDLITGNCNTVGCDLCQMKWPLDSEGNSCRQDYLTMQEYKLERKVKCN